MRRRGQVGVADLGLFTSHTQSTTLQGMRCLEQAWLHQKPVLYSSVSTAKLRSGF